MNIVDYDKKMEKIEDFYTQAVEILKIVYDSIEGFRYVIGYNLLEYDKKAEEQDVQLYGHSRKKEVDLRKKQLIIELSRAGEYAIKYILSLKQMEDYPQQSYEEFLKKAIYCIGEKGVGNTYIHQYHIDNAIVDRIRLEKDKHDLQPLHDYNYLFYILKELYPNLSNKVHESFIMNIKNDYIEKSYMDKDIKKIMSCFPQCSWVAGTNVDPNIQKDYIDEYDRIREESGDAFTRLRYIENNKDNKQYDLKSIRYYLYYLILHIKLIHDVNKNNVNKSISLAFSKDKFMNLATDYVSEKIFRKNPEMKMVFIPQHQKEFDDEYKRVDEVFNIIEKNYETIINSFDYSQVRIYEQITNSKLDFFNIYENIVNNIKTFANKPYLFAKIPILLETRNTIDILNILKSNGLDEKNIQYIDSTIFCIPSNTVDRILNYLKGKGENFLIDNKINSLFFKYLEAERLVNERKNSDIPPLPISHRQK